MTKINEAEGAALVNAIVVAAVALVDARKIPIPQGQYGDSEQVQAALLDLDAKVEALRSRALEHAVALLSEASAGKEPGR